MTPPDLTPEQEGAHAWDEGFEAGRIAERGRLAGEVTDVIDRLAAEAGSKRARTSQLHRIVTLDVAIEAVREGAAAGVAASEARVREAAEALRLLSDPDDPPFADWSFIDPAEAREEAMQAFARSALAALLSEEPVTTPQPVTEEKTP